MPPKRALPADPSDSDSEDEWRPQTPTPAPTPPKRAKKEAADGETPPCTPKKVKTGKIETPSKKESKESPGKKKFTEEEDLKIMKWFEDHKNIPALREILPGRHVETIRGRVKTLFERWKVVAGT